MRTKRSTLTVKAPPPIKVGRTYKGKIRSIELDKKANLLTVVLENLHSSMAGRRHRIVLSAALFPGSQASGLFAAAGLAADEIGAEIDIKDAAGAIVGMRFENPDGEGSVEFKKTEKPAKSPPKQTKPVPDGAQRGTA